MEKGAAVTIGNVYEPYLEMTHNFGILHQRLLAGDCWVEACWKAMPVVLVAGGGSGRPALSAVQTPRRQRRLRNPADNDFRALRAAALRWPNDAAERLKQLDKAAERTQSGVIAEAVGLELLQQGLTHGCRHPVPYRQALYVATEDKLRQDFHLIAIDRAAKRKDLAVRGLRDAQTRYGPIPEAEALKGWLDILDPPPPPPAVPPKGPTAPTPVPPAAKKP